MNEFMIIETESGLMVVQLEPHLSPEDVAARHNGSLIDPGPYPNYDEAYDALLALRLDEADDQRD
jgi:hypothetical protein